MPKVLSKFRKSRKNVSKRSINKTCNKFSLNKTQLNNSSLIDFDKFSNEYYFSTELNWEMFYNIQHKEMLDNIKSDIENIVSKNNIINKNINKIIQDDKNNKKSNDITLEEVQTIKNHFINLESLVRQKFLKFKTK
jgi:hypothetical protein